MLIPGFDDNTTVVLFGVAVAMLVIGVRLALNKKIRAKKLKTKPSQ